MSKAVAGPAPSASDDLYATAASFAFSTSEDADDMANVCIGIGIGIADAFLQAGPENAEAENRVAVLYVHAALEYLQRSVQEGLFGGSHALRFNRGTTYPRS